MRRERKYKSKVLEFREVPIMRLSFNTFGIFTLEGEKFKPRIIVSEKNPEGVFGRISVTANSILIHRSGSAEYRKGPKITFPSSLYTIFEFNTAKHKSLVIAKTAEEAHKLFAKHTELIQRPRIRRSVMKDKPKNADSVQKISQNNIMRIVSGDRELTPELWCKLQKEIKFKNCTTLKAVVIMLYEDDFSLTSIAKVLQRTYQQIRRYIKEYKSTIEKGKNF